MNIIHWFLAVPGHHFVPLFHADEEMVVHTRISGSNRRRLLSRSAEMEQTVIELVEGGLRDESWKGLLYVMGWGDGLGFRPLYIGKTERKGRTHSVSRNIADIRKNRDKFARWGDAVAFHIGDLSHAVFGFEAYRKPTPKYKRWAETIFDSTDPPRLKRPVSLYLAPWAEGAVGPSGLVGSLAAVEKEAIALASVQFADCLLNVDGA